MSPISILSFQSFIRVEKTEEAMEFIEYHASLLWANLTNGECLARCSYMYCNILPCVLPHITNGFSCERDVSVVGIFLAS
mgnify:CR=1 FL=1